MKSNHTETHLVLTIVLILLAAALAPDYVCGQNHQVQSTTADQAQKKGANPDTDFRTVIKQNGRIVKIPKKIDRVVIASLPLPSIYYAITGSTDNVVGVTRNKLSVDFSMLNILAPKLMDASTNFVNSTDVNVETVLKLRPDLVFYGGLDLKKIEQFDAVGIPTVGIYLVKGGNALESLHLWAGLLGQIFNKESRVSDLVALDEKTMEMIHSRVRKIPQEKKTKALILFHHNAKKIDVNGTNSFAQFWLEATGGVNVSQDITGMSTVNMEQIYKWNPDIIYITNFSRTLPEELIRNTVKGQDWSKIKAVKEKRVYKVPSGIYRWYAPSADASLMLKWMAQINHPGLFSDYDIKEEIRNHYSWFYNYDLSNEEIDKILYLVRESG
ncbi:MAG: ABC transporter substrate-binding protein [Desulfobacteraceae bacterium]|jgi:iron complex transport system substrate-binding protein